MKFSRSQGDVSSKFLNSLKFLFNNKEQAMNHSSRWYRSILAGIALVAGMGFFTSSAFAQLTAPGTDITNQANLSYSVGGVAQTAIPSNTTTFKVDRLVRVTVAEVGNAPTSVVPGALAQVTTFTVTNNGNLAQAYTLAGVDTTGGTVTLNNPGPTLFTDNLALTGCSAFVESGATLGYQAAQDTALAITTLAPGISSTVYVVCNIPNTAVNGNAGVVSLTATTAETAGCTATGAGCTATVATALAAPDPLLTNVDIVFGDVAGTDDAARDGKHSARDAYFVVSATLAVNKTQSILCDPVNFNVTPRAIPGAYVQYAITVSNTGSASATLTQITDALNANLNIDPNLVTATGAACPGPAESVAGSGFKLSCPAPTARPTTCPAAGRYFTTTSSVDGVDFSAPNITATFATALAAEGTYAAGELKAGESVTLTYNAIIK
jgi:uncharacterized repeat protein (TIGR01451 family)